MNSIVVVLFFIALAAPGTISYNILVLFPYPGRSHFLSFVTFFKGLAEKGHNVTVLSHYPLQEPVKNYRDIEIGGMEESFQKKFEVLTNLQNLDPKSRVPMYFTYLVLHEVAQLACEMGLTAKAIQQFLREDNKFDVAITEYFNTDCFLTLIKQLNVPVVRVHSCSMMPWTAHRYGNPHNPAYIPNHFMPFADKMTFLERVENTLVTLTHSSYFNHIAGPKSDSRISLKYFDKQSAFMPQDVYNDSLLLMATHFTLNFPRPLVPNVIEVGGIHVGKSKPLSKNLEKWIKESPHGVIYFSFGSLVKGYTMPADKRQAFINAFKRLPQRVIWKWENDTMEGKSDNIMIGKWLPQFDILSHPNVKAFISHGGLLGTFEAVHCGVPILVMPQFGDQHTNAKAIESVGGGEILYLSDATEEKIYNALTKTLSPSFQQQAKELSERFRDRPMPPLETAIYWVEYVARHKGAHFMKTAAVGMPFYQYYLLDVIAFLLAVLILFLYLVYLVLRFFVRLVFKPKQPTKVKKS